MASGVLKMFILKLSQHPASVPLGSLVSYLKT